jgi:hypothetical protein
VETEGKQDAQKQNKNHVPAVCGNACRVRCRFRRDEHSGAGCAENDIAQKGTGYGNFQLGKVQEDIKQDRDTGNKICNRGQIHKNEAEEHGDIPLDTAAFL